MLPPRGDLARQPSQGQGHFEQIAVRVGAGFLVFPLARRIPAVTAGRRHQGREQGVTGTELEWHGRDKLSLRLVLGVESRHGPSQDQKIWVYWTLRISIWLL
jgi:hypothetical protein